MKGGMTKAELVEEVARTTELTKKHAELIVNPCFTVGKGDVVTIICDDEHAAQAKVGAQVASEKGAWPVQYERSNIFG